MTGRVAGAADLVPASCELLAELEEVVDLAVEDADDVTGLVLDRLAAGDEVDDLQAPVAEHAAAERVDRALVRARDGRARRSSARRGPGLGLAGGC